MTQMVSAERAAALRNKCLNLTKTCRLGSGSASERTSQWRQLMSPIVRWHETDMATAFRNVRSQGQSGKHLLALSFSDCDPSRTYVPLAPTNENRRNRWGFWPLRHSRLPNLIVGNLVRFMYLEEAVPSAKCDALANTYL